MINIYKYIFYRNYKWQLILWGPQDVPQVTATLTVGFIALNNIFTAALCLEFLGILQGVLDLSRIVLGLISVGVAILFYFQFLRDDKYKVIGKEFENEGLKQKIVNSLFMWLFVIGTFAINIFIVVKL